MINTLNLSTEIIEFFSNKKNISSRASIVWFFIYKLMKDRRYLDINISLQRIATESGLSKSTVQRALRELKKLQLMSIEPVNPNWVRSLNYYSCFFPGVDIAELINPKKSKYNNFSVIPLSNDEFMDINEEYLRMTYNETNQQSNQSFSLEPKEQKEVIPPIPDHLIKSLNNIYNIHSIGCDFFSQFSDPAVEQIITNSTKELEQVKAAKKLLEDKLTDLVNSGSSAKSQYDVLQEMGKNRSLEVIIEGELNRYAKNIEEKNRVETQKEQIFVDEAFIAQKVGGNNQVISSGLLWWVKKELFKLGVKKEAMALRMNEIFHAVRFGALSHVKYRIHDKMPVMKGINIALKLIKAGRWQEPASFNYGTASYG